MSNGRKRYSPEFRAEAVGLYHSVRGEKSMRELRIRHYKINQHRTATIRYKSKLHHIGMGRALNGTRVILLVAGRQIRVLNDHGEPLRQLTLDPSRDYQPRGRP